jgi:hypothetical protein
MKLYVDPSMKRIPNISCYHPENTKFGSGYELPIINEMLVSVRTNLKLDIIEKNGSRLVDDKDEEEMHYIKMESYLGESFVTSSEDAVSLITSIRDKSSYKGWVITDIDNHLHGNPLVKD